jgi:hypothetical protein
MIPLKYLVVSITNDLQIFINKTLMYGRGNGIKYELGFQVIENTLHPFQLPRILCKNEKLKLSGFPSL